MKGQAANAFWLASSWTRMRSLRFVKKYMAETEAVLKELGFETVVLDPEGYVKGKLNGELQPQTS